jgi:hypothetical protein
MCVSSLSILSPKIATKKYSDDAENKKNVIM